MSKVQGDIGVSIGLSEEELNRGIARVSEALNGLAKTVEQLGKRIDQTMAQAAGETQKTAKATKELAQEEKAAADSADKHAASQRRLTEEQKKAADAARQHKKALEDMKQGLGQISTATGIAAAAMAALAKVSSDAYKEYQSAFLGLEAVAERTIGDTQAARAAAESLVEDGLMSIAEASKGLQNLLMAGFGLPEAVELMKAFKDAAAFNRQAALGFGEAVVTATEGIKNGNSILVDNAGITKNLSVILTEAGYSAQDLQKVQSDLNVRMALYNGILKEAETFAGNAAKAADTLAGAQARAATEAFNARAAFGEALAPAMQALAEAMTDVLGKIGDFVEANPDLVRSAFLVVGGITAVTAAVGGLTVAVMSLNTALGPAGGLILLLSAVTGGLGGVALSAKLAADEAERNARATVELAERYKELERVLNSTTATAEERKQAEEELKRVKAELGDLMPELVTKWDAEGKAIELNTQKLDENTEAVKRNLKAKADATLQTTIAEYQALKSQEAVLEGLWTDSRERQRAALQALGDPRFLQQFDDALMAARLGPEYQASAAQAMDQIIEMAKAQAERELALLRRDIAIKGGELNKLAQAAAGGAGDVGAGVPRTGPTSPGGQESRLLPSDKVASALRRLEHRRTMEQITPVEYIAGLEEIKRTYELTAEQLMDIDERIHRTRKQLTEQEIRDAEAARKAKVQEALKLLDHERNMGWLSVEEEAKRLKEILDTYELTTEERWSLEERLARAVDQLIADQKAEWEKAARERARSEEERVRAAIDLINHRVAMGELALDQEIAALEAHLARERDYYERHTDELWSIEERLYRLREQARQEELKAQEQAAREAQQMMQRLAEEQRKFVRAMAEADLKALRDQFAQTEARQQRRIERLQDEKRAAEEAQQARIRGLQDELAALERLWAAEDRRNRLADLRAQLAEVMADTSYQWVNPETGQVEWTYDRARARELEKQIAEAERDDERARIRERLQDQIQAERDRLDAIRQSYDEEIRYEQERLARMRDVHQQELADRQAFWDQALTMETEQLAALAEAAQQGMDVYVAVFQSTLAAVRSEWSATAAAAEEAASRIQAALAEISSAQAQIDSMRMVTPTMPASLPQSVGGGQTSVSLGGVSITVHGATDPQATAAAVRTAAKQGTEQGLLDALIQAGQTRLRTG